jgi:hypothetical protein
MQRFSPAASSESWVRRRAKSRPGVRRADISLASAIRVPSARCTQLIGIMAIFERADWRLMGEEATRESELREAHRLFLEIGAPIRAAEVAKELGL